MGFGGTAGGPDFFGPLRPCSSSMERLVGVRVPDRTEALGGGETPKLAVDWFSVSNAVGHCGAADTQVVTDVVLDEDKSEVPGEVIADC